ncbi:MAG: hypothetical protein AAF747_00030 [Planctomycetota bacterium]
MPDNRTPANSPEAITGPKPSEPSADAATLAAELSSTLASLRARSRLLLLVRAAAWVGAITLGVVFALALFDFAVRVPAWLRFAAWLGGVAALGWAVHRHVLPAWRFAPSLTDFALRVERTPAARDAGLTGLLAAGVELGSEGTASQAATTRLLASTVVMDAAARARTLTARDVLDNTAAGRPGAIAGGAVALALVLLVAAPTTVLIGAGRVLLPWTDIAWPKRTAVSDATEDRVYALGEVVPLRASLLRSPRDEPEVAAIYRVVVDDRAERERRVLLTPQDREVGDGTLYERLIEPTTAARAQADVRLEYRLESGDDQTSWQSVQLARRPEVSSLTVNVTPPSYASDIEDAAGFVTGEALIGAGSPAGRKIVVGPVLAGSTVSIRATFNKPLPLPTTEAERTELVTRALGVGIDVGRIDFAAGADGEASNEWVIESDAAESVRLTITPTDELGLTTDAPVGLAIDVTPDRVPTAVIIEPARDASVLPTAVVTVQADARDDVGLASLSLVRQVAKPDRGSVGAAPEPVGDETVLLERLGEGAGDAARTPRRMNVSATLTVADVAADSDGLLPGDEIWVTAIANDAFDGHGPARSAIRRLRIIDEGELAEQLRAELGAVRRSAMRLDEQQADVAQRASLTGGTRETTAAQRGVTSRLDAQLEAVERLSERVERNQLDDEALAGLLDEAGQRLSEARQASNTAADRLDAAGSSGAEQGESGDERGEDAADQTDAQEAEQLQEAAEQQDRVRDELDRLIRSLDRGEDAWTARRSVERLRDDQQRLRNETARAAEQTTGRSLDELTQAERSELERLAERQRELADRAREAIDDLADRADDLRSRDPSQASSLAEAAARGREQALGEQLEQASQQIEQNQTQTAQREQQQALEAIEQMLEDLDRAPRNRDETLDRVLSSVIESLETLIAQQEEALADLDAAVAAGRALVGLDAGMIRINTNTLAVLDQVEAELAEAAASVIDPLEQALTGQASAIRAIRDDLGDAAAARAGEQISLDNLIAARDEAERLQSEAQQRENERERDELRRAYVEALREQVELRERTDAFADRDLDRRTRRTVRDLGEVQTSLRTKLAELRAETDALQESVMFDLAHDRLDAATERAAEPMREGRVDARVLREQRTAERLLRSLVETLTDPQAGDEDFGQGAGGGGDGGGGQGGEQADEPIPPIAELRLLRAMQAEAYELTRAIDEAAGEITTEELGDVAELQDELATRGQQLLEVLQQQMQQQQQQPQQPEQGEAP